MSGATSDTKDKGSSRQGWTDRDKLAYLYILLDSGNTKPINWNNAPLPAGRTVIACQRMFQRLGDQLKDDIERLKSGATAPKDGENGEAGAKTPKPKTPHKKKATSETAEDKEGDADAEPKTPKAKTPRKKKAAADGEEPKTPRKRTRKPKTDTEAEDDDEEVEVPPPLKKVKAEQED